MIVLFIFALLLAGAFLISQLLLHNGFMFRILSSGTKADYDRDQAALEASHVMPDSIKERNYDGYSIYQLSGRPFEDIVINIHGGGLTMGNRQFNRFFNARLAEKGVTVLSVSYPLVPEASIRKVFQTVTANIRKGLIQLREEGCNTKAVRLCGDSAGAFICLYLAALKQDKHMRDVFRTRPLPCEILSLGLMSGMYYTTKRDKIGIFMRRQIWGNHYKQRFSGWTEPEFLLKRSVFPRMHVITSEGDYLKSYSQEFYQAALRAGQPVEYYEYPGSDLKHAFQVFHPELPETEDSIDRILRS